MIEFANFSTEDAIKDDAVGISVRHIIKKEGLNAYATFINAGKRVGCHNHSSGDEWYIILSGEGEIWTGEVLDNEVHDVQKKRFSQGCIFCIYPNTAHQLVAYENVKLIFLCPESHLSHDRVCFADICE
ncbi:quercetin dioxygenase-like cupin family protein [Xenorhabdus cabanillasii]|uniref:Quercetin dioxygenase-like cupin family protein n=1 Tax=Xenorhabdus cabanillasii TaxID=351673 RepID=A0A3D9ULB0_9GAMM|nr:quercetin dioxygenase-like cupin family protein [Xenorhabdus cabanillasii]